MSLPALVFVLDIVLALWNPLQLPMHVNVGFISPKTIENLIESALNLNITVGTIDKFFFTQPSLGAFMAPWLLPSSW